MAPGFSAADHEIMARALRLAERGLQSTTPNPRVGCVIVKAGQVVGEGWHLRAGGEHAEVHALQAAGERARGATVYVTLEPCSHHGRTPPCADALLAAGVTPRRCRHAPIPIRWSPGRGWLACALPGCLPNEGLLAAEARNSTSVSSLA
jgi:diaminohydroxyphosphoribosylaminopyrimidine deaminase/5-amino-6-(5-phosphoribosylamino)uracil reductase